MSQNTNSSGGTKKLKVILNWLLLIVIVLDVCYFVICVFFPEQWFKMFHGSPYVDPQGLLRRNGAIWGTMALFQLLALINWRRKPYWLAIIGGLRGSEIFAEWVYLYFARNMTGIGSVSLLVATPLNIAVSFFFIWCYLKIAKEGGR
jgi:Na+-driven multidrug efflux pump